MKLAISIPDPVFRSADRLADRLGISRSEIYGAPGAGSSLDPLLAAMQARSIRQKGKS